MKYVIFSDDFLSDFRLDDNGKTLVLTDKKGYTRAVKLLPYEERRIGRWINHRNDNGHNIADCSLCGKATQWHDEDEDGIPRYCWYCGASMKGDAE